MLTVAYEISLGRAKQACSILIGPSCQAAYDPWSQFWNVTIPGDKPTVTPIPDPKVSELDTKYTDPSEQQPSLGAGIVVINSRARVHSTQFGHCRDSGCFSESPASCSVYCTFVCKPPG